MSIVQNNVLLVIVDNLRPALGAYGVHDVLSPHIDALAAQSTLFSRAYCSEAWCAPSRNSFLSGRRPDTSRAWNFRDSFRASAGGAEQPGANWTTLPGWMKQRGYYATSSGKVFHPSLPANFDYPRSWSDEPVLQNKWACQPGVALSNVSYMACEYPAGMNATAFSGDNGTATLAIERLRAWHAQHGRSAAAERPFFLAVGFQSPRLPWSYPRYAAARYNASSLAIARHRDAPAASTGVADATLEWFRPVEVAGYADVVAEGGVTHGRPLSDALQRRLRLAYYAAISHVDDQVGRLLAELRRLGVDESTAIVFTADHGQNLGEANMWSMMNLLETSLRVPLLVRPAPRDARFATMAVYDQPVELVDLFPTVAALAGVAAPPAEWRLPGRDLTAVLRRGVGGGGGRRAGASELVEGEARAAFSQITRCSNCTLAYSGAADNEEEGCAADGVDALKYTVPCALTPRAAFDWMGMSVRTANWRYTVYCAWSGEALRANWSRCAPPELFNHSEDVALYDVDDNGEPFANVAGGAASGALEARLRARLRATFDP
jgi:arylsulfatase A-like enzyme